MDGEREREMVGRGRRGEGNGNTIIILSADFAVYCFPLVFIFRLADQSVREVSCVKS